GRRWLPGRLPGRLLCRLRTLLERLGRVRAVLRQGGGRLLGHGRRLPRAVLAPRSSQARHVWRIPSLVEVIPSRLRDRGPPRVGTPRTLHLDPAVVDRCRPAGGVPPVVLAGRLDPRPSQRRQVVPYPG